ncbi:ImmA/IrrE family metallo-endopeptidase [Sphingomonas lacunae]|uniref:ImmA/IrrE family metallo-endopeptidase n=1 Tax=Sphingomonas lacunae TaxID=2698828 RepID=A0A6M4ATE8_9SPHN|nr:XRE family transcriptional regulator [Sphingomonas lacunae]QJQ32325.1 ImmA/IrrE family metallo-endopeptidase [Sphingomonas lacunae]
MSMYQQALDDFDLIKSIQEGISPVIVKAQRDSYIQQIEELSKELNEYEQLKSRHFNELEFESIYDIGKALIQARISKRFTQSALANAAGLREQQIQKYEKEFYESASLRRLSEIAVALGLSVNGKFQLSSVYDQRAMLPEGLSLEDFPIAEMNSKGWFNEKLNLRRLDKQERQQAISEFIQSAPREMTAVLHRKTSGRMTTERLAALLAWQARILTLARARVHLANRFTVLPADICGRIAQLSSQNNGIIDAIELLLSYGIIVVFAPHLQKTKIDGAAMSLDGQYGVIGMSLRHDRVDNFWFVLLHELGHLVRHWDKVIAEAMIDESSASGSEDRLEKEADEFAENAILPTVIWRSSLVRFTTKVADVKSFAARHNLHPALIAGRIRRERGYNEFSGLLGSGEVRAVLAQHQLWDS